jgi:hypothetical protein
MEVTIGWWAIPAAITLIGFTWLLCQPAGQNSGYGVDLTPLLAFGAVIIIVLFSWMVYGLLT